MSQDPFKSSLDHIKTRDKQSITREPRTYDQLIAKYAKPIRIMGLVDATGSMKPVWDKTLESIQELIRRILEAGRMELSWVAYRDYCDQHRIIEQSDWSSSVEYFQTFMDKISCNGGGDFPEAVEKALEVAIDESDVSRVILIGDAPPHEDKDYRGQAIELGKLNRPVFSFVVGNHPDTQRTFGEISQLSSGVCFNLENHEDILDLIAVTVIDQIGGQKSLGKYLNSYGSSLSPRVKKFIQQLPPSKN